MVLKDWANHWAEQSTHRSEQRDTRAALHNRSVGVNGHPEYFSYMLSSGKQNALC